MRKIKNPWLHREGYDCFGCCPDNPIGLHMEFFEEGDEVRCYWSPQTHFQGWIDTLHGGIQATLIDEIASWVVFRRLQTTGVTTRLNITYRKAVMTTEPQVTLKAQLVDHRHRLATIHVQLENADGVVCTQAEVTYLAMDTDKAKSMGFTQCELEGDNLLPL
ncbi:MAG: PaaI family thioesterase [Bacteroidaceae bacterium]|nr:PaaI family thioesterase [Bacteroidaceae bacterium]